jgi:hypothetical protein
MIYWISDNYTSVQDTVLYLVTDDASLPLLLKPVNGIPTHRNGTIGVREEWGNRSEGGMGQSE